MIDASAEALAIVNRWWPVDGNSTDRARLVDEVARAIQGLRFCAEWRDRPEWRGRLQVIG